MSKVFDCFIFRDEVDILEIRLSELDGVVDHFVLCEATRTFANKPKPLHFLQQRDRFSEFLPKIQHVIVDDFPSDGPPSQLEQFQRNALVRGLTDCGQDDVVLVSNADEIPNPEAIRNFRGPISGLRMRQFGYYLNLENVGRSRSGSVRSVMCRYEYLRSPQWLREFGQAKNVSNKVVDDGGWWFSHLSDADWIGPKLCNISGQDRNNPELIRARVEAGELSVSRDEAWQIVPVDTSFPAYLESNQVRYRTLLGTPGQTIRQDYAPDLQIYFEHERPDVLDMVPLDARRILELGCATGRLGAALKRRQDCHVTGIEYSAEVAERTRGRLDRVIEGDCENLELDVLFQPGEFDCLIAADVLEHLRDPEDLLWRLQPYLTADADIVVSIPNVRHAGVLQAAAQGHWTYQSEGILDRTHLRFFTRREIRNMFARLGFEVEEQRAVVDPARAEWERMDRPMSPAFGPLTVKGLSEEELREFFVIQWLVRARSAVKSNKNARAGQTHGSDDAYIETIGWDMQGLIPGMTVAASEIDELTSRLVRQQEHTQRIETELSQCNERLIRLQAESTQRDGQLAELHQQYLQVLVENSSLRSDRDAAHQELALVVGSTSWRLTGPLRKTARQRSFLRASARRMRASARRVLDRSPTTKRILRRIARIMWLAVTLQLQGQIASRVGARNHSVVKEFEEASAATWNANPEFVPRQLSITGDPLSLSPGTRGRLICLTHVLPEPPRAGNDYRIKQMLQWLAAEGWDVLLLVCPAPSEPKDIHQVTEAARIYPNIIVCQRDGTLLYRLRDGGAMLEPLRGRQPRNFPALLGEKGYTNDARHLIEVMRIICPDVLVELLLHVDAQFKPQVLLAEYVFMTRPFALLRPGLLKIVDTIDVFSSKQSKVTQYGIQDSLFVPAELEAQLLNKADFLIAIQDEEAAKLRELAPERNVIQVGVDFKFRQDIAAPVASPVILLVGSRNANNVKGLSDFLKFAWPLIRKALPEAELRVVGAVGDAIDTPLPNVRILGQVGDLEAEYSTARVVINPAVAGTGLKIKTVEALCHLRPAVVWPSGVDGMPPEMRSSCRVARNWFEFANHVIELAGANDAIETLVDRRSELARLLAPETVYAPLRAALEL